MDNRNVTNNRFYPTHHKTKKNAKIVGYGFERSKHGNDNCICGLGLNNK